MPHCTCMFTVLPFQDCAESCNPKQMSPSRAPSNESSGSALVKQQTGHILLELISANPKNKVQHGRGCSIVLRCASTSRVRKVNQELDFRCAPPLSVSKTAQIPHYSFFFLCYLDKSSGIPFGIASGGFWKSLTVCFFPENLFYDVCLYCHLLGN